MFKGIKILFNLIFRPHKLISSTMFNKKKRKNILFKPLKYGLIVFGCVSGFAVFVMLFSEGVKSFDSNRYVKQYIRNVEGSKIRPDNSNGTINGLNLLLIDSIKTEGYVKDYLSLLRDFSEGEITSSKVGLDVGSVIGISVSESGTYSNTGILPKTFLPWDSSENSPLWNKSVGGLPAEATTLRKANKNVFSVSYIGYAKGPLYTDSLALGAPGVDNSIGPFQINHFDSSGYSKSVLNGYGESSSRSLDATYFPDNLSALTDRFISNVRDAVPASANLDSKAIISMYSAQHNPGPGALLVDYLNGVDVNNEELVSKQSNLFIKDLDYIDTKYGSVLSSVGTPAVGRAFVALALIDECGWNYFDMYGSPDLLTQYGGLYEETTGKSPSKVINGKRADISGYARGNAGASSYTGLTKTQDGVTVRFDSLAMYHMWQYLYRGNVLYAQMLKYAGVDVDPTNPNTYMNSLPEGEWTPSGNSAWMDEYGLSPTVIGEKRTKLLNEAVKWIGSWYSNHNPVTPPEKGSDGTWIRNETANGFDCSSFVQYSYQTALGIDVSRTTWTQRGNPNTYVIDKSEAKPGDLIYYYDGIGGLYWGHVAFYINENTILHSPQPGYVIGFSHWDGTPTYQVKEYRRVKGVE